jgi:hypothetical protein
MSYLSRPQINFAGTAYCNPSTANNNDFADIFDVDTLEFTPVMTVIQNASGPQVTVIDPLNQQTFPYQGATSASDCRTWLMGLLYNIQDGGPYGQQAHWNYYGDHATRLDSTTVKSVQARPGVVVPSTDPLLTATVSLIGTPFPMQFQNAVIVDNDPYALITSQIFSHGIQVTATDGTVLISASPASRAYAYYISVFKNLDPNAIGFQMVSAVFQLSVLSGPGLTINTANSPALIDLASAVAAGAGLQMRFCFYDAIYQIAPNDLHNSYAAGKYISNPYIGLNLGSIGVLQPGELLSAPPGRKLTVQTMIPYTLSAPCGVSTGNNSGKANLGATPVNIDLVNQVATLDCISTFPECNVTTNTKYDFGPMTLDLVSSPTSRITLGNVAYDQTTYETYGGLVEIPLTATQVTEIKAAPANSTLAIHSTTLNQDVLTESPGLDIQTEDRAIYFDAQTLTNWNDPNEQPVPGTGNVTICAFQQGQPVQNSVTVNLEYWMCDKAQINPSKPMVNVPSRYFTVAGATQLAPTIYPDPNNANGTISVITDQVTIPANGQLTLTLTALRPGTSVIRFVDPTQPHVTPNFVWDNCNYSCVRILPFDDFRAAPDSQVNEWPFIYANFFNYFALLYPIMSRVIPWGPPNAPDNSDFVKQFATNMKTFTDPINWNTTIYMPITREMSAGKRALLWRWCSLQGA